MPCLLTFSHSAEIAQKSSGFPDGEDTLAVLIVFAISSWFIIIFFACLWLKKKKIKGGKKHDYMMMESLYFIRNLEQVFWFYFVEDSEEPME